MKVLVVLRNWPDDEGDQLVGVYTDSTKAGEAVHADDDERFSHSVVSVIVDDPPRPL